MRKTQIVLSVVAVYLGLLWTGFSGTVRAETQFTWVQSAKIVGAFAACPLGDGATGHYHKLGFSDNPIEAFAWGIGDGELIVRIIGPHGFSKVYNIELDPSVPRHLDINFRPVNDVTTGETSRTETSNHIEAHLRFNTTGVSGKFKISASCSGSLTSCDLEIGQRDGNHFQSVYAGTNSCGGSGAGRMSVGSTISVDQDG
jgi:hypothetical protein